MRLRDEWLVKHRRIPGGGYLTIEKIFIFFLPTSISNV